MPKTSLKVWWDMLKISKGQEKKALQVKMCDLDIKIDNGFAIEEEKKDRLSIKESLYRFEKRSHGFTTKAKITWSIEGDEKSKYYHGILNCKRK